MTSPRLVERYEAYRLEQGRELLRLLPREGLRVVLQRAEGDDLDGLARVCSDLLPLPPLSIWLGDFRRHRDRYEEAGSGVGVRGRTGAPVTVDVRLFSAGGVEWVAALELFEGEGRWTGRVRFHRPEEDGAWFTGEIFRESRSAQLRAAFLDASVDTLRALLRSVLP